MGDESITNRTELLVQSKSRFLTFLEGRLGNRVDAEDLLQTAYARAVAEGGSLAPASPLALSPSTMVRQAHHKLGTGERRVALRVERACPEPVEGLSTLNPSL